MGRRDLFLGLVVVAGATLAVMEISRSMWSVKRSDRVDVTSRVVEDSSVRASVKTLDTAIEEGWRRSDVVPSAGASDLAVMRRMSLALTGSIPSLEEIRKFESKSPEVRLAVHRENLLKDRRTADYLAERLARSFVGTEDGPFVLFRRRRFVAWLSDALLANRPYDQLVREMIQSTGLWTDHPATNFVSVTFDPMTERPDPERLAARVSRAFLGIRIDCARCHDHPFQPWKQEDFHGLAAFFGGVRSNLRGIVDGEFQYSPDDARTKKPRTVTPHVPARPELCPSEGMPRERLASWVVDPRNPNLSRVTVNRVWALMYGRPLVDPVDDLPVDAELPPALVAIAQDFTDHNYDLHRLIRVITSARAFGLESTSETEISAGATDPESLWASFPLTRLRPEQIAGSLYQSSTVRTMGPGSPWLMRFISYTQRNDFVRRYGDTGEDEFNLRAGTIPQRLLLMNGDLVGELIREDLFTASSQIATLAPEPRKAVASAYLAVLTRLPSAEESEYFVRKLDGTSDEERKHRLTDLYWTLLNSTEFSWNH